MNNEGLNTQNNSKIKILIVEDSPTQAQDLMYALKEEGFKQVDWVENGKKALVYLEHNQPAFIISDVMMPEMDGFQLCTHLKGDERFKDTPVILLTTLKDPHDIIKGLECGADNFITKPYEKDYLR